VFDDFSFGVQRTYIYDLHDDREDSGNTDKEYHFGLFHYDGSPKASAAAFHNLMQILRDGSPQAGQFQPEQLIYSIANTEHNGARIYDVLLEKADGEFDVVLWSEPDIWDAWWHISKGTVTPSTVSLRLRADYQIGVYDPMIGPDAIYSVSSADKVDVGVSDHPVIVQVKPIKNHEYFD
jgi:hypothetical protein